MKSCERAKQRLRGSGQSCGEGRAVRKGFLSEKLCGSTLAVRKWDTNCEDVGEEGKVVQDNRELC